ncbi:MAG: type IV secretory system conjugative DNA transfer family protein [Clostridia bacterium]|nr:type IV secretory system conjugative DNA transfer family protein [Clostridia bacterium]
MKKFLLLGASFGAIVALAFYFVGAPYLHSMIKMPLFSPEKAWLLSVALFIGIIMYFLYKSAENTDNRSLSADKRQALNHAPSKEYFSRNPDGLTVGKHNHKYVRIPFLDSPEHQLIIGAPGDGKSTTIENAILWNFNFAAPEDRLCSILAVDVKPELSRKGVYEGREDIKIINPSIMKSCGFDIFYGLTQSSSDDELAERCTMIANTVIKDTGSDNVYFAEAARNIFTAFLMYGFRKGFTFGRCIDEMLDAPAEDLIAQILSDEDMNEHRKIKRLIREFDGKTSDGSQDVMMTLKKDLAIFDTDSVKACFAADNPDKVSPVDLVNGTSIFLAIPDHLLIQYATVFRLILNMCMTHIMAQDESKRQNKRSIWVLVDEAGSIGKLPILGDVLARGRSKGIQCSLVIQSEGQLDTTYGRDMTRTIKDCCKTTIVFGSNDVRTCEDLAKRTGMYTESKTSTTTRGGTLSGDSSKNESSEYRPVVDVADIQNLTLNGKVLIFARGDWFLVDKAPYFKVPMLNEKSVEIKKQNDEFHRRNSSD